MTATPTADPTAAPTAAPTASTTADPNFARAADGIDALNGLTEVLVVAVAVLVFCSIVQLFLGLRR